MKKWEDALPALLEHQQAQTGPPAATVLRQVITRRSLSWAVGLGLAVVAAYAVGTIAAGQIYAALGPWPTTEAPPGRCPMGSHVEDWVCTTPGPWPTVGERP